ncbi:MAG: UDP-N-acetylmuramoyl-L-alanyl-D-glutamate--2,6-diaminopimelate ligase [Hyphomicrobium sp.]
MQLSELAGTDPSQLLSDGGTTVTGLTADSRLVKPGFVFVAVAGTNADGSRFITDAIARGAIAIVVNEEAEIPAGLKVPVFLTAEPRRSLALMAARYSGAQPETVVAVTGTSGKTSVAEFTRQIFKSCGRQSASLGTIGVIKPAGAVYGSLTTPDPVTLHATLAELSREGVTHLAMEASSHGLDQFRLDGVRLSAAAFTNLGRDHLDYHPTVHHYFEAKMRLFSELLKEGQPAVINTDGQDADDVIVIARARGLNVLTVGTRGSTLKLLSVERDGFAQRLSLQHGGRTYSVLLPLVGAYQVENALVAAGLAIAVGEDAGQALEGIAQLSGVKGRLEIIGEHNGGLAVVDYAHKPEALIAALDACRPFVSGKLICVFGCGGDRDRGKRPRMGGIATDKADVVIITDDNPRTETAASIRSEILQGAPGALEIGDRREAIEAAVGLMGPGDVVLVAGKGHETGQIVGNTVLPFSDHDVLRTALGLA